jgi:hypothetical protein
MKTLSIQSLKEAVQPTEVFYDLLGKSVEMMGKNQVHFCCFHDDKKTPNLHIYPDGRYCCFACNEKGDFIDLFQKITGVDELPEALKLMAEKYAPSLLNGSDKNKSPLRKIVETYPYRNEEGKLLSEAVRFEPKEFSQRCPDGKGGWNWNLNGVRRVLYCLPELLASKDRVYICEGEKDVDCLRKHSLTATTCPMGAGKWKEEYDGFLKDREVIMLPDNDELGRDHMKNIAKILFGTAKTIKVVALPNLPEHGDVSDYLETHSKDDLLKEIEGTPFIEEPPSIWDQLESWEVIQSMEIKVEWMVDQIIPKQGITLLFGKGGIGKTWLVMDLARCIGSGESWLGYETQQASVIFIDFENPLSVLVTRAKRLGDAKNVRFWRSGNREIQPPKLDSAEWEQYKELPEGAVLIFDTLRASQGGDENDSREMSKVMNRMKELRDMGFTVILLHHTAKCAPNTSKGSTAIVDLADHNLGLTRVKQKEGGKDTVADDDVEGFDTEAVYNFGNHEKTRFEPHNVHLKLNPDRGFELAPDPEEETLKNMHQFLQDSGPLQKTAFSLAVKSIGVKEKKARKLIGRGVGRLWSIEDSGQKNAQLVTAIQFGSSATPIESAKLPNLSKEINHGKIQAKETEEPSQSNP